MCTRRSRRVAWRPVAPSLPRLLLALCALCGVCARAAQGARFAYLSYADFGARLAALAKRHPEYVALETAQSRYGLPHVGTCGARPCETWLVTMTERGSLAADAGRAEVLISGEVHGDEVIGPHAVLAYVEMVVRAVEAGNGYFLRMLRERVVVLLPLANAVGFYRGERGELQGGGLTVDPNRDFGFDQDAKMCMRSVAARAINEVVREGLFRILVTFHGGTNVVGYEWGDMTHCHGKVCKAAPDEGFMKALGDRMSGYAGPAGEWQRSYPVGTMGGLVYPVHGGMEDWAYGASWSGQAVVCEPETLGGYAKEKTVYGKASHRVVTYLVETALSKKPPEATLGDDADILTPGAPGDGHVPRNVRLLVATVDSVAPYVTVNASAVGRQIDADGAGNASRGEEKTLFVAWHVGGAFQVDGSHLQWSDAGGTMYGTSDALNGTAGAPVVGASPTLFKASVPQMPRAARPLYLRVAAVVDSRFGITPRDAAPPVGVQSHLVGARVDPAWAFENGGKTVKGRAVFYSKTLRAKLDPVSGELSVAEDDGSPEWADGSVAGKLRAPTDVAAAKLLKSLSAGASVDLHGSSGDSRSNSTGDEPGKTASDGVSTATDPDPRDRNAVVSGVVGVLLLLGVTGVIVVAIVRHHRKGREAEEGGEDLAELKVPLQNGAEGGYEGDVESGERRLVDEVPVAARVA